MSSAAELHTSNRSQKQPRQIEAAVPLIGVGRAFRGQNVRDPRLGLARPPKATPYAGGRPDPGKNYAGIRRPFRIGSSRRYVEGWNADNSGFAETHNRVADPTAKYVLAEEQMPETLQRPEPKADEELSECRAFAGPSGFHGGGEEFVTKPPLTVEELAHNWGIDHGNGNGHKPFTPWTSAEKRQHQQRLGEPSRVLLRVLKLRVREQLPKDKIADLLGIQRAKMRNEIWPKLVSLLGPDALAIRKTAARDEYGRIVGGSEDE